MKRTIAFVFLVLSALVFILSYLPAISESSYGNRLNLAAQAGMSISILLFFIFHGKKEPPTGRQDTTE
jgi:hypothetical protein